MACRKPAVDLLRLIVHSNFIPHRNPAKKDEGLESGDWTRAYAKVPFFDEAVALQTAIQIIVFFSFVLLASHKNARAQ